MADGSVIIDSKLDKSGLEAGLKSLGGLTGSALGAVTKGLAAVTGGLIAAGGAAASVGMSFDSAMSQVAATMGKSVDEIQLLSDKAQEMGATTKFSATEAAQALNYLALAGYDAATAADTLPAVLNLAAAGGMDLAYASDLATDAMSALGIEASNENLTEFGDAMAMTASKANTSVAQLGEAILTVGGTANTLAGGTTELNTALGVLANRGIKGAEGGTHLRNVILSLTAPTKKASDAMKALGVSATDSEGNMRPLNDVLADLDAAMDGLTDAQKTEVLNTIFNKTDIAAVQGLIAGLGDEWDNLSAAIDGSAGAMQRMADTQIDNLEGDIQILKSSLEGLGIAAYEGFREPLRGLAQLGSELVTQLTNAMKTGGFEGLASALGDVLARGLAAVTGYVPKVVALAGKVLKSLCNGFKKNAKQIAQTLKDVLISAVTGIAESLPALIDAGAEIAAKLISALADALPTLLPKIVEGIGNGIAALAANAGQLLAAGVKIAAALVAGIISSLPALAQSIVGIFGGIWKSITGIFNGEQPDVKVTVNRDEPDGKISDLKFDLEAMQRDGYTITVTVEDGVESRRVQIQSFIDEDGNTVELKAKVSPEGNVEGFITSYNGVDSKTITLSALKWDVNGAGDLVTTIEDAHGNTITLTAQKDDQGNVVGFISSINGLPAEKPVTVVGTWSGDGIPETIDVDVAISDSKNTLQTVKNTLDDFKTNYATQTVDIQVTYNSAQPLIDELGTIQSRVGLSNIGLFALSGFSGTVSGMSGSLSGVASQMKEISSNPQYRFTTSTKNAWHAVATDIESMAGKAGSLGSDLAGLAGLDAPDMPALSTAAGNATSLAAGLLGAANNLDSLAKNPNLQEGRRTFLTESAENLREMANSVSTVASELTTLSGKEYLSPEDKERMVELTNQLLALYPQLSEYVGENGILNLEAAQVRALTEEYRNLALQKAAGQQVADAAAALAALQLEQERLEMIRQDLEGQNEQLIADAAAWQAVKSAAEGYADGAIINALQDLRSEMEHTPDTVTGVKGAMETLGQYLALAGQGALTGVEGFENLVDEMGNLKTPEEIMNDAEALSALRQAMISIYGTSDGNLDTLNAQIDANSAKIAEATATYDEYTPSVQEANTALEQAIELQERIKEATGGAAEASETAGDAAAEAGEAAQEGAEAVAAAAETIDEAGEGSRETAEGIQSDAETVQQAATTITQAAADLQGAQTAAEAAQSAVETAKTQIGEAAAQAYTDLQTHAANITLLAQGMLEAIKNAFGEDALVEFLNIGAKIAKQINNGMKEEAETSTFSNAAKKVITKARDAAKEAVGENGKNFNSVGRDIAKGVAAGIDENTKFIVDAVKKAMKKARDEAKKEDDSHSPSKKYRDEVGQWIPKGIAVGIDEHAGAITESLTKALGLARDSAAAQALTEQMYASVAARNMAYTDPADGREEMDYDALAEAVWRHMPEDFAVNQTVNFNRPMQAPDEIAREMRQRSTYGLVGGRT